jgi:hypothetical protein
MRVFAVSFLISRTGTRVRLLSIGLGTGALGGYNQFTLDGTNITQETTYNNQNAGSWNVAPNVDAIQEVNVMTTTYDARYSRTGGGTVNVVTKNGTDSFHGDLYDFYETHVVQRFRSESYQANNPWLNMDFPWAAALGPQAALRGDSSRLGSGQRRFTMGHWIPARFPCWGV